MSYHDHSDIEYLKKIGANSPDAFKAFAHFDEAALRGPNKEIPRNYTEMIALAVAFTTQCAYCIDIHTAAAKKEGVTTEELAEVALIAAALRAGGAMTHGALAMKLYDEN
ncbi:carboxymuconolactone decarboxylase family protein [Corynebacterium glutamicum]|uniref:Carboxymuconolactone decarboxylase-like domain-containing protein n=1 Tax=Corynebacterium glutamicum (strain R) TaxID=340322 RepID=A0AB72VEK5_CORGB|nr:carboxymuconolactone decarboxylase family protein [Corynebacterium glutamicum]BAF55821.1 hypothetical protein cgR_2802 [Corynebacterium glutamicum R]